MSNALQPIFDDIWAAGEVFFRWLFDGWIKPKTDFDPIFNETKLYNSAKNKPILVKEESTDKTETYIFTIPVGMTIKDFMTRKEALAQFLKEDPKNIKIELDNNMATVTIYDTSKLNFDYRSYNFDYKTKEIRVPIGISLKDFSTVYWNPTEPNECHMLIGGSTGSGKSVALNVILEHLCRYDNVELYLQDTKMVDLINYQSRAKIYNEGTNYAVETLKALTDEMVERYGYLKKYNYKNMEECNRKDKPKYIFYVLEELASFGEPKGADKEFYKYLSELLAKGRAAGIGVIITTQAPYSEILPGMLKNNINSKICLKTTTGEASKVISGDYDLLTGLRGKGHGYLINAAGAEEIQVFNI